jgi:hypothetical protein
VKKKNDRPFIPGDFLSGAGFWAMSMRDAARGIRENVAESPLFLQAETLG